MLLYTTLCILLLTVAFTSQILGFDIFDYEDETERTNKYIDGALQQMRSDSRFYPLKTEDMYLEHDIIYPSYGWLKAGFHLSNGSISGLGSIHRSEESYVEYIGDEVQTTSVLSTGPASVYYDGYFQFKIYPKKMKKVPLKITANISHVDADIEFAVNSNTGLNGRIIFVEIKKLIDITVHIDADMDIITSFDGLLQFLEDTMPIQYEQLIEKTLEKEVEKHFAEFLKYNRFPVKKL